MYQLGAIIWTYSSPFNIAGITQIVTVNCLFTGAAVVCEPISCTTAITTTGELQGPIRFTFKAIPRHCFSLVSVASAVTLYNVGHIIIAVLFTVAKYTRCGVLYSNNHDIP